MTTTQITNIAELLDLTAYAGDYLDDYDMDAVRVDYVAAINDRILLDGVTVYVNGDVIADVETADDARDIDWKSLADAIDASAIFERHDVASRITKAYDSDGFGLVNFEGRDLHGNLVVAWGPDTRDENGAVVDEITDQYWIGTAYTDDQPGSTYDGTKDMVEAWARAILKKS